MIRTNLSTTNKVGGARKFLSFDVMKNGGEDFVCTMKMPYNPLFKLKLQEVLDYILSKRPTLKYEKGVTIFFND